MTVVVTGAKGYIGRHVMAAFGRLKDVKSIPIDVDTVDILARADDKNLYNDFGRPDAIVHLAWKDGFKHNSNAHLEYLGAHYRFLTNMIDVGCTNITVMGSMHEVGYYEGCISDENPPPCNPLSPYGIAKNALRQAIFAYVRDKGISLKWLRGYYITGDEAHASSVFAKIFQMGKEGKETFPFTDGKNRYDFIDVDDLSDEIVVAALTVGIKEIINVCSGKSVSLRDKVEEFIRKEGLLIRPAFGMFPSRPYDSPEVYGSNTKIMKLMKSIELCK